MIIGEIVDAVKIAGEAIRYRAELNKTYFERFIAPIWEKFTVIHGDYKISFNKYLEIVAKEDFSVDSLLAVMRHDSFDTADLRSELTALLKSLPAESIRVDRKCLERFIESLLLYFAICQEHRTFAYMGLPNIRWEAFIAISRDRDQTRKELTALLENMLKRIQDDYAQVAEAYYELRRTVLG
jgi:hypothetical protein